MSRVVGRRGSMGRYELKRWHLQFVTVTSKQGQVSV